MCVRTFGLPLICCLEISSTVVLTMNSVSLLACTAHTALVQQRGGAGWFCGPIDLSVERSKMHGECGNGNGRAQL